MKYKNSINRFTIVFASLLLCAVFSSCGTTHVEFYINWWSFFKTIGLLAIGVFIGFIVLYYLIFHSED
jgi:hypothetical protein